MPEPWAEATSGIFLDTNVLFYAYDVDSGEKHVRAGRIVESCFDSGRGRLSVQVIQEFAANLWRSIPAKTRASAVPEILNPYLTWKIDSPAPVDVLEAIRISGRYTLSFWDAMIVRSAKSAGAEWLLTEDMQHGQKIDGVKIYNPFKSSPAVNP